MYLLPKKIHSRFFSIILIIIFTSAFFFLWFFNVSFSSFYFEEKENDLKARATLISSFLKSSSNVKSLNLSEFCINLKKILILDTLSLVLTVKFLEILMKI